ncbi:uncharacterized protein A1O9_07383 [Exophiala aquamarina CBS 119918]|uniref:Alpha/beta hydrolase fold-3 domain-containing protein n=1 Tax=Exophiala aquamarina CBS 119918 TaxID=1182545 RepID=A0A072PD33_9EURO|nr:uncharacterized protein A1O9_07383 [Exophiala aquamarina CBS 119918]KEF57193.1 hypothetical protein A1O9_07383 [Exophiala aquamarina CBS 119918]
MPKFTLFSHYLPAAAKAAFLHLLGISETASIWDIKTALLVALLKATFTDPRPGTLLDSQQASLREAKATIPIHLLKVELALPADTDLKNVAFAAIKRLGSDRETFTEPTLKSIKAEWVGHRKTLETGDVDGSEAGKFSALKRDMLNHITILYLHGGQFWRMGRSLRKITDSLAKETGGCCFAVQYRLSPQNPFPAALLDGLAGYLCLLYPPEGGLHDAVHANDICFAGDSSGGNLVLALIQLILEIRRPNGKGGIVWQGSQRELPLPAGVTALSPYNDMTRALDSSERSNYKYDIIPRPGPPFLGFDRCSIWPASPPRHHVYANDDSLAHPLVSPVTAKDWWGAPPTWICVGEECLADQGLLVAQNMASQGVTVAVEQYQAMPHNFALIMDHLEASTKCKAQWASFIRDVVDNPLSIETRASKWSDRGRTNTKLDIDKLVPISPETLAKNMHSEIEKWGSPLP